MTAPAPTPLGGFPGPVGGSAGVANQAQTRSANFPTLNPPTMKTLVYAPNVRILIGHKTGTIDVSPDIVRGAVGLKENSASSLAFTLANHGLRYNRLLSRMDRVTVYLTGPRGELQVFSGYLDTVPYLQAYPGTIDVRATCTLKRLLHHWWNPGLPESVALFDQMSANLGTEGDGQGQTDTGLGSLLRNLLVQIGGWPESQVHIQNFPQQFLIFLNNYFTANDIIGKANESYEQFKGSILGSDTSPGPMGSVGYRADAPIGASLPSGAGLVGGQALYLTQIVAACDQRGMGPIAATDLNSQTVLHAGEALQAARDPKVQAAGEQTSQYAQNQDTQNKGSDAAILAAACVMVETQWRNLANPTVPDSLKEPNDGTWNTLDCCGLFAQRNDGQWGLVSQRMNPFSAAGMFFDKLARVAPDWRNMDAGTAIYNVQLGGSPALFGAQIAEARTIVQAFRTAKDGASNTLTNALGSLPGGSALSGAVSSATNMLGGAVSNVITGGTGGGTPTHDSEGAINAARYYLPTPYQWGGKTPGVGLDCSGLVSAAFESVGIDVGAGTEGQRAKLQRVVPPSAAQRGDILQTNYGGHTGIYLGNGSWIQTGGPTGTSGSIQPINPATAYCALRACPNGGYNPGAPFNPIATVTGGGTAPGTGTAGTLGTGSDTDSTREPIARNLFSYQFLPGAYVTATSNLFTGEKRFIDGQPLIQMVQAVAAAGLRNFQSAPNGDFIAYYPDHFGMDGKKAIMNVEDIELTDCTINISDDPLTTHVYVNGDYTMMGQSEQVSGWLLTAGVATVENQALFARLSQPAPGEIDTGLTADQLMKKFGVRPLKQSYQMANNPALEFLIACQIFMGKWAAQYTTNLGITYMPELRPGMRINLVGHNLQVYVSAVTHTFDWERGFSTAAQVGAASNPNAARAIYQSVPGWTNPTQNITALNQKVPDVPSNNPDYIPPSPSAPGSNPLRTSSTNG